MAVARKHVSEPVIWDQAAILNAIQQMTAGFSALSNLTGNPAFDSRGVAVREVRKSEELILLEEIRDLLQLNVLHLSFINEITLKAGDS